jgi:hypothetical protein
MKLCFEEFYAYPDRTYFKFNFGQLGYDYLKSIFRSLSLVYQGNDDVIDNRICVVPLNYNRDTIKNFDIEHFASLCKKDAIKEI